MRFIVTVYHGDDSEAQTASWCGGLTHSASLLGSTTVSAKDEREASAKAWIALVGQARAQLLVELKAPAAIIAHQTDVCAVVAEVRDSAVPTVEYERFNLCEVWYFCVTPLPASRRLDRSVAIRPGDAHGPNDAPPAASLLALLTPSKN